MDESAPTPVEPRKRRVSFALVGQAAAVVGLIAGILGLLFTFAPGLRPEKKAKVQQTATLELADVNDAATLREYLGAEGIATGDFAPSILARTGVLATVRYTSTGLEGKKLPLVVSLTDRATGMVACEHTYEVAAGDGTPPVFRAWAPYPARSPAGATFNLHVTLFAPDRKPPPLDARDHNGLPGPKQPQPGAANAQIPVDVC
jgi:hypothetical protein